MPRVGPATQALQPSNSSFLEGVKRSYTNRSSRCHAHARDDGTGKPWERVSARLGLWDGPSNIAVPGRHHAHVAMFRIESDPTSIAPDEHTGGG